MLNNRINHERGNAALRRAQIWRTVLPLSEPLKLADETTYSWAMVWLRRRTKAEARRISPAAPIERALPIPHLEIGYDRKSGVRPAMSMRNSLLCTDADFSTVVQSLRASRFLSDAIHGGIVFG